MKVLKKWTGILFVMPSLIGVMIFYIIPFISSLGYCFTRGIVERKFVGLHNFMSLFQSKAYRLAIGNTLSITGVALPILCVLAVFIALLLERQLRKYKWIQGLLLIPMALPSASLMLLWQDLFMEQGIINEVLKSNVDWLNSEYAKAIIVLLIIWKNIGYSVLLIINSLLMMPKEYSEAASLDGAGFIRQSLWIKVPYIVPVLFFTVIISLVNCFKIFREVYLLQGDYPSTEIYLLQHFMNNNFNQLNYEILSSSAFILYLIIFIIVYLISRWQQKYISSNV